MTKLSEKRKLLIFILSAFSVVVGGFFGVRQIRKRQQESSSVRIRSSVRDITPGRPGFVTPEAVLVGPTALINLDAPITDTCPGRDGLKIEYVPKLGYYVHFFDQAYLASLVDRWSRGKLKKEPGSWVVVSRMCFVCGGNLYSTKPHR